MDPISTATSFLGILKSVINFEPEQKIATSGYEKVMKNMSADEKKLFNVAHRLVLNKPRTQSITKQLEKAIAHYPLIVSDAISSEVAIDLSKINESRIAEYIKIILQTDKSALDIDKYEDIGDFMNQFKGTSIFRAADVNELVKEGCELQDVYEILESLIKDETIGEILYEAKMNKQQRKDRVNLKASLVLSQKERQKNKQEQEKNRREEIKYNQSQEDRQRKLDREEEQDKLKDEDRAQAKADRAKKDKEEAELKYISQKAVDHNIKVAKGANQTVPTVVEAEITFMKGDSQAVKKVYLAIKSMLHIVPGTDMMDAIAGKIAKGGFLTKVIKWYTGEISFIRDIFLNLDEIKSVEGTSTNKGQYIVDKLFDFTKRGNVNAILDETGEGKFIPTTTLAISIDDVMYLKSISGINLLVENDARRIMKEMGLLAVMVVDELKDVLYVFDDGAFTSYEVFSLSGKTKEDKTNSKLMTAFFGNKKV